MAVREIFLISLFTMTSDEHSGYNVEQTAEESGIKQGWMPDPVIESGWRNHTPYQPEQHQ